MDGKDRKRALDRFSVGVPLQQGRAWVESVKIVVHFDLVKERPNDDARALIQKYIEGHPRNVERLTQSVFAVRKIDAAMHVHSFAKNVWNEMATALGKSLYEGDAIYLHYPIVGRGGPSMGHIAQVVLPTQHSLVRV